MLDSPPDDFLSACGAVGPLQLLVQDAGGWAQRDFTHPNILIGRDPRADISVDDRRLSKRHAFIQMIGGRILFANFSSLLASPGQEPQSCGWLDPGKSLTLGPLVLRLPDSVLTRMTARAIAPLERPALPVLTLDLANQNSHTFWRMHRPLALIGNSAACKIRLRDSKVSRFHCALVNTSKGLWAVDLLSRGGIMVNGNQVRSARLDVGVPLQIGSFTLTLRPDDFVWPPSAPAMAAMSLPGDVLPAAPQELSSRSSSVHLTASVNHALLVERPAAALPASQPNDPDSGEIVPAPLVLQLSRLQQEMFVQMQQQMSDQFQQMMGLFVDAFWAMFREQSQVVRRELKRIRRLTAELTAIQHQLANFSPAAPVPANALPTPPPPAAAKVSVAPPPAASPPPPPASGRRPAPPKPEQAAGRKPNSPSPAEMHAWLHQRVNEIQKQRNSSWQKILKLLQGKSTTPAAPPPAKPVQPS